MAVTQTAGSPLFWTHPATAVVDQENLLLNSCSTILRWSRASLWDGRGFWNKSIMSKVRTGNERKSWNLWLNKNQEGKATMKLREAVKRIKASIRCSIEHGLPYRLILTKCILWTYKEVFETAVSSKLHLLTHFGKNRSDKDNSLLQTT